MAIVYVTSRRIQILDELRARAQRKAIFAEKTAAQDEFNAALAATNGNREHPRVKNAMARLARANERYRAILGNY